MIKTRLAGIDIRQLAISAIFKTPFPKPQAILQAEKGLNFVEQAVEILLEHQFSPEAIRLDDIADLMGNVTPRTIRKEIKRAQKIALDNYDGEYDPPLPIPAESLIYRVAAHTIYECGRLSGDLIEYTVRTYFDSMYDIEALETESDMACWAFMIEYYEDNLRYGSYRPTTPLIKQAGSRFVSRTRMETFLKKNFWWGNSSDVEDIFNINIGEPTITEVALAGTQVLEAYLFKVAEDNESSVHLFRQTS